MKVDERFIAQKCQAFITERLQYQMMFNANQTAMFLSSTQFQFRSHFKSDRI